MDQITKLPTGSFMANLIDQDIAHIGRVMWPSLQGDAGGSILPASYWRRRLNQLLDASQLTKAQLCSVDSLLLQLNQFEGGEPAMIETAGPSTVATSPPEPPAVRRKNRSPTVL